MRWLWWMLRGRPMLVEVVTLTDWSVWPTLEHGYVRRRRDW
jgi:hypothetical protein